MDFHNQVFVLHMPEAKTLQELKTNGAIRK
jgi:hypothetical protein